MTYQRQWRVTATIRGNSDTGQTVTQTYAKFASDVDALHGVLAAIVSEMPSEPYGTETLAVTIALENAETGAVMCKSDPIGARPPCVRPKDHPGRHHNVHGETWNDPQHVTSPKRAAGNWPVWMPR